MIESLLQTKLYIPPLRPKLVPRSHLIERLSHGLQTGHKLTLVSAPAGFGKTTLVSEWVARSERPTAWLSLDEGDNNLTRFLAYFVAALQAIAPNIGEEILGSIQSSEPPPLDSMLTSLVNELTSLPDDFIAVLDDFHVIEAKSVDNVLSFLLENLPQQMHLVIATRQDPDLHLGRLRAQDQLTELRAADLRFSEAETAEFLNLVMGLEISGDDIAELESRTEGWIAGLQMAAISMQGRKDKSGLVQSLSGSHHFILDYLVEEVLDQQPPDIQEFLLETSILKQLTATLCGAVTGVGDSQTLLTQLEQANLFLVPLDDERRWYRYHHLFADLLASILRQRKGIEEVHELHLRASRWHRARGYLEEAMFHTIAAQDFEQAALMIEDNFASMFARSEVPVLLGWIEMLPQEIVREHPWIDVYRANTLALASQLDEIDPLLEGVEGRIKPEDPRSPALLGHIAAIHAFVANLRGDAPRSMKMALLAEKQLPASNSTARGMAAYTLADTSIACDDMASASQRLLELIQIGQESGQLMMIVPALCDLAFIKKVEGQLFQAKELYDKAYQWMKRQKGLDSRVRCAYEFGLADLLREWNQVDAAYEHLTTGFEYRQRLGGYLIVGEIAQMRVLQARGNVEGIMESLRNAEQFFQTHRFQLAISIEFKTARVVQCLEAGDVETASHWAKECRGGSEREQIALARLRLAQGRMADAQRLLANQHVLAEEGGRAGRLIEILGLLAIALQAQGKSSQATATLSQAIFMARPEGYKRLFLDMGRPLSELLERLTVRRPAVKTAHFPGQYERDLLDTFRQERAAPRNQVPDMVFPSHLPAETSVSPLTERELDVLRLLAEGLSNKEIAGRLIVAPSTVKQHLKNIYGKLDVHSRTQAVARGRELNLL